MWNDILHIIKSQLNILLKSPTKKALPVNSFRYDTKTRILVLY